MQPSTPNVAVSEGDGGDGGGGGEGSGPQAMVCIELASGNLQRNVSVNVMTISSPTSTGNFNLQCLHNIIFLPHQLHVNVFPYNEEK